jgi:hypothetical protein
VANTQADKIRQASLQILNEWLESCTRNKKISRNTVAMGIVTLNHLRQACPITREVVI